MLPFRTHVSRQGVAVPARSWLRFRRMIFTVCLRQCRRLRIAPIKLTSLTLISTVYFILVLLTL